MHPTSPKPTPVRAAAQEGLRAARHNAGPAALIVAFAVSLILGYHHLPPVHEALEAVAEARERVGIGFAIISTALFGGALPLVFRRLFLGRRASPDEVLFGVCFWGYKGVEVALLYEFQAWLWGTGTDVQTLFLKVLVDQGIYCPLVAVPTMTLGYLWLEHGFRWSGVRAALRREGYWIRALPVLISNAMLWIPAVVVIYMFPTPLQLPLQNLVLTFWVLVLIIVAAAKQPRADPRPGV